MYRRVPAAQRNTQREERGQGQGLGFVDRRDGGGVRRAGRREKRFQTRLSVEREERLDEQGSWTREAVKQ